jgi:two-component system response regulator YesN
MGFTIASEAGNGQEALDIMRSERPDLVVSDIIMPEMDGIELLKRAREEGLESLFVMLTCMNEFEYARQALDFGATSYLLKLSMNAQSLEETLTKIKRELVRNFQARSQAVAHSFQRMYRETWQAIHNNGAEAGEGERLTLQQLEEYRSMLEEVKADSVWIGSFLHGANQFALEDFHKLGLVTPGSRSIVHVFAHSGQTTVFIWNPAIIRPLEEKGVFPWTAACSPVVGSREMPTAWNHVLRELDHAWYEERTGLFQATAAAESLHAWSEWLTWKTEREWIRSFEQRKLDEFKLRLQAGWETTRERRLPMAAVKEMALRVDRLLSRIAGCNATAEEEFLLCTSHSELGERLLASAESYCNRNRAITQPLTGHREVDKAVAYIHQHYSSDVTLKAVAALVAMDEAYFSGLFKKKTGATLIHYIQQVRIEHAKGWLEQTELSVAEIGERVGFPNANYFIKIFRRWTRRTPSEYRSNPK